MSTGDLQIQGDWDAGGLREAWHSQPDHFFALERLEHVPVDLTAAGATGPVLEVAAADASHACRLNRLHGLATFVVEPSPAMLAAARDRMREHAAQVTLVRSIGEALPFADGVFDRVLCDSAIDHFADPERGIREMARVARPDGRIVLSFVNYGGASVRLSRLVYRLGRALGRIGPEGLGEQFWDTPVPIEHTFECTVANVTAMCRPYLDLDRAVGISLGWGFPGWGALLLRHRRLAEWPRRLDRLVRRLPAVADAVVMVWKPRPRSTWPVDRYRTRPSNPVHQRLVRLEAAYWDRADFGTYFADAMRVMAPAANREVTGDPDRSWIGDLARRGPFGRAAVLGLDDVGWEAEWLRLRGSARVDVYDLSRGMLDQAGRRLGTLRQRARFVQTDLNFAALPAATYDVVWSSNGLSYLVNLEHLCDEVAKALRPGGLFVVHGWVGPRRFQHGAACLARSNALLATVPARYRRVERVASSAATDLSPFGAVRSDEIVALLRSRFEVVSEAFTGRLYPLAMVLDVAALERDEPALLARIVAAERLVRDDPGLPPAAVYGVYRKRP